MVVAGLFVLSVFVQFFLAGLGVFGAESFKAHKDFGGVFHLSGLLLIIIALLVRRNRVDLTLVITLFVITAIQFSLPEAATATSGDPRGERPDHLHRRVPRAATQHRPYAQLPLKTG